MLGQEARRDPVEVVAEGVVGGEEVPAGALELEVALLPAADRLRVHRVAALDVEEIALAAGPAAVVGVPAGVEVEDLVPLGDLADGQPRRGGDLAEQEGGAVALDELLGFRHRHSGVRGVLGDQLDLPAQHAPSGVGLVHRLLGTHHRVGPELAQEAGARGQVTDLDGVLRSQQGRHAERARRHHCRRPVLEEVPSLHRRLLAVMGCCSLAAPRRQGGPGAWRSAHEIGYVDREVRKRPGGDALAARGNPHAAVAVTQRLATDFEPRGGQID